MARKTEFQKIIERAEVAKINVQCQVLEFEDEIYEYHYLEMPNGKDIRKIPLRNASRLKNLSKVKFEDYVFLGNYEAISNYGAGEIEAIIATRAPTLRSRVLKTLCAHTLDPDVDDELPNKKDAEIFHIEGPNGVAITIKLASPTIQSFVSPPIGRPNNISITLTGLKVKTHDAALKILEKISNSIFFEFDLAYGMPLSLMESRDRRLPRRKQRMKNETSGFHIEFPKYEYETAPISLYWYARGAVRMPLLQYLGSGLIDLSRR